MNAITSRGGIVRAIRTGGNPVFVRGFERFCQAIPSSVEELLLASYYVGGKGSQTISAKNAVYLRDALPLGLKTLVLEQFFEEYAISNVTMRLQELPFLRALYMVILNREEPLNSDDIYSLSKLPSTLLELNLRVDNYRSAYSGNISYVLTQLPANLQYLRLGLPHVDTVVLQSLPKYLINATSLIHLTIQNYHRFTSNTLHNIAQVLPSSLTELTIQVPLSDHEITALTIALPETVRGIGITLSSVSSDVFVAFCKQRLKQFDQYIYMLNFYPLPEAEEAFVANLALNLRQLLFYNAKISLDIWQRYQEILPRSLVRLELASSDLVGNISALAPFFTPRLSYLTFKPVNFDNQKLFNLTLLFPRMVYQSNLSNIHLALPPVFSIEVKSSWGFLKLPHGNRLKSIFQRIPKGLQYIVFWSDHMNDHDFAEMLDGLPVSIENIDLQDNLLTGNFSKVIPQLSCLPNLESIVLTGNPINITKEKNSYMAIRDNILRHRCEDLRCHNNIMPTQQCGVDILDQSRLQLPGWLTWRNLLVTAVVVILLYAVYAFYQSARRRRKKQQDVRSPSGYFGLFQRKQSAAPADRPNIGSLHIGLTAGAQATS